MARWDSIGEPVKPCITACGHMFCRACIEMVLARAPACPLCRTELSTARLVEPSEGQLRTLTVEGEAVADAGDGDGDGDADGKQQQAGGIDGAQQPAAALANAKLEALMVRLVNAAGHGEKSVVFSQWMGMLDIVELALRERGLPFVRLDGSVTQRKRAAALRAFSRKDPGSPAVFLSSLRSGGEGLNLTAANSVHLLDPWWNPQVEEQGMARIHRIGATRPVSVFRYIAVGTIEERMLALQESKRRLAAAAFERLTPEQMREMRVQDIKLLMEL